MNIDDLDIMDGYEFEDFIAKLFKKMNYNVHLTPRSRDKGADLMISKYGERAVVQVKKSLGKIGVRAVQEIVAAINVYNADYGIIVTNGSFTKSAKDLAKLNNIKLIDRDVLSALINQYF